MTTYQLIIRQGPKPGHVYALDEPSLTIGRDPMSDIVLSDPEVSRYHARLIQSDSGQYQIEDMGSTNGTFVDGQKVSGEPVLLRPGQLVVFGSSISLLYQEIRSPMDADALATIPDHNQMPDFAATISGMGTGEDAGKRIDTDGLEASDWADVDAPEPVQESIAPPPPAMPDFMQADDPKNDPPAQSPPTYSSPPSPPSTPVVPSDGGKNKGKRTTMMIVAAIFLLLCCCCSSILIMYYWLGDIILAEMGLL